jgi:hypothetical protein
VLFGHKISVWRISRTGSSCSSVLLLALRWNELGIQKGIVWKISHLLTACESLLGVFLRPLGDERCDATSAKYLSTHAAQNVLEKYASPSIVFM